VSDELSAVVEPLLPALSRCLRCAASSTARAHLPKDEKGIGKVLTFDTAHYRFIVTSCGSSGTLPLSILRSRISKPRQESAPHKVTMNHIIVRESGGGQARGIGFVDSQGVAPVPPRRHLRQMEKPPPIPGGFASPAAVAWRGLLRPLGSVLRSDWRSVLCAMVDQKPSR
jgi:hypothetical protein